MQKFSIIAQKFDGSVHRTWECDLVRNTGSLYEFLGIFDLDISHPVLGNISRGTYSHEFYWLDRWYNVFRFHRPDGDFMFYYCNVNMPPEIVDSSLVYKDLDLDVLVRPGMEPVVLDRDEFEENREKFNYPNEVVKEALKSLDDLIVLARNGEYPFNTHALS